LYLALYRWRYAVRGTNSSRPSTNRQNASHYFTVFGHRYHTKIRV